MKKHVKNFLNYLENETELEFDNTFPTSNTINQNGDPIKVDTVIVNGKMSMSIISCGHKKCKSIIGLLISYGLHSEFDDAVNVSNIIKNVAPEIPIDLMDELFLFRE